MKLLCATGNKVKFDVGAEMCKRYDIELEQTVVVIDEIQGEDVTSVIEHKARAAYELLGQPVIVSDDFWHIPALGGFPGPYMKSINQWFTPNDFIRLMAGVEDRTIILAPSIAYCDHTGVAVFSHEIVGQVSEQAKGTPTVPVMNITVHDMDNGLTIAEVYDQKLEHSSARLDEVGAAWKSFAMWYQAKHST